MLLNIPSINLNKAIYTLVTYLLQGHLWRFPSKKLATESQSFVLSQPIPQLGQEFSIFLIWMRSLTPCYAQGFADRVFVPYWLLDFGEENKNIWDQKTWQSVKTFFLGKGNEQCDVLHSKHELTVQSVHLELYWVELNLSKNNYLATNR